MKSWDGAERRKNIRLSDEEKREIALEVFKFFQLEVGKGALRLILYVAGLACIAGLAWLAGKGWIK
jgi:hypothetical protein